MMDELDEKLKRDASNPIRIRLKGGDGTSRYVPGDALSCSVEIHPDGRIACRGVEVTIGWYTEGKGRRDEGNLKSKRFDVTEISSEQPFVEQFDVELPRSPWSFAGHFINIVWAVRVKIDIAMAADTSREQRFILQP